MALPKTNPPGVSAYATYARALAPLLPPEAFRRRPQRLGFAALQLLLLFGAVFGIRWADSILTRVLASVVAGHALLGLAFFAHELTHGVILGRGATRRLVELLSWCPNLVPPTVWRKVHNETHHRHANTPSDPDRRFLQGEERFTTRLYTRLFYPTRNGLHHNPLILLHFIPYVLKHTLGALLPNSKLSSIPSRVRFSWRERGAVVFEVAVIAFLQWGLFRLSGAEWDRYLFVGPLAVCWTSAFVMLYVFTNHFANPISSQADPLNTTTSVIVPPFFDRLHLHFSYHTEHHLFPAVDSAYYPLISRLLVERFPREYRRLPMSEAWRLAFAQPAFVEVNAELQAASPPATAGVDSAVLDGR